MTEPETPERTEPSRPTDPEGLAHFPGTTPTLHDGDDDARYARRFAPDSRAPFTPLSASGLRVRPTGGWPRATLIGGALGALIVLAAAAGLLALALG